MNEMDKLFEAIITALKADKNVSRFCVRIPDICFQGCYIQARKADGSGYFYAEMVNIPEEMFYIRDEFSGKLVEDYAPDVVDYY
jgi:hypothetical protein